MRSEQERLAREWAQKFVADCRYDATMSELVAVSDFILATTSLPTMADVEWDKDEMPGTGALTKHGRLWIMRDDAGDAIECISPDLEELASVAKKGLTPNGKRYELREVTDDHPEPDHPVEPSTKTMDEYSPEEQADMIGMWAEYRAGEVNSDFVIIEEGVNRAGRVPCYNPEAPVPSAWAPDPDELTPRFDLPRVWDKGGQPCKRAVGGYQPKPEHPEVLETAGDYENAPEGTIVASDGYLSTPLVKRYGKWCRDRIKFTAEDLDAVSEQLRVLRWGWDA